MAVKKKKRIKNAYKCFYMDFGRLHSYVCHFHRYKYGMHDYPAVLICLLNFITMLSSTIRKCLSCGAIVRGRPDKKYCDESCRNSYNNRYYSESHAYVRNINQNLKKNRTILERLLPKQRLMARAPQYRLYSMGFRFQYYTHTHTNKNGKQYFFCYEYGYLLLDKERVLIVKRPTAAEKLTPSIR